MSAPHAVPEQRLRVHGLRLLAVLDVRRGLLSRGCESTDCDYWLCWTCAGVS